MRRPVAWLLGLLLACIASPAPAATPIHLVVWAPGYPGTSEQAQATMDELARALEDALGRPAGSVAAVYHERLEPGLERLGRDDAAVALVPLPVYLEFRERLGLRPWLQAVPRTGAGERWTLVAPRGRVEGPHSLRGWELTGLAGYSPRFVRRVALSSWGSLPDDLRITFGARAVAALRRAAKGEDVAVLLDTAQAEALPALPFAASLEVVTRSRPVVASVVCLVGERLGADEAEPLRRALLGLDGTPQGVELLTTLRMVRFQPLEQRVLEPLVGAFAGEPD